MCPEKSKRFLSVNSLAPELTVRFRVRVMDKNRVWYAIGVRVRVSVRVRFRVMVSVSVNDNNSGAGELADTK